MQRILSFLKLTALGGLLILLPILLFILLLMEIVQLIVGLATPIAELFPAGTFNDPEYPVVLAILLILGASMLLGIALKSKTAIRLGRWIEERTIARLPIYRFVKALVPGLVGVDRAATFKPALFEAGDGLQEVIYVVEELDEGSLAALFPYAPTGFAGPVKIVPRNRITPLDASLGDVSLALNHMGLGLGQVLKKAGER